MPVLHVICFSRGRGCVSVSVCVCVLCACSHMMVCSFVPTIRRHRPKRAHQLVDHQRRIVLQKKRECSWESYSGRASSQVELSLPAKQTQHWQEQQRQSVHQQKGLPHGQMKRKRANKPQQCTCTKPRELLRGAVLGVAPRTMSSCGTLSHRFAEATWPRSPRASGNTCENR